MPSCLANLLAQSPPQLHPQPTGTCSHAAPSSPAGGVPPAAVLTVLCCVRLEAAVVAVLEAVSLAPRFLVASINVTAQSGPAMHSERSCAVVPVGQAHCSFRGEWPLNRALCRATADRSVVNVARLRRARQPGGSSSIPCRPHRFPSTRPSHQTRRKNPAPQRAKVALQELDGPAPCALRGW